jgi:hypothetical protein
MLIETCVNVVALMVDPFNEQQTCLKMVILGSHWVMMLIFFKTTFTMIALFKVHNLLHINHALKKHCSNLTIGATTEMFTLTNFPCSSLSYNMLTF